jgi:hypothetical protein
MVGNPPVRRSSAFRRGNSWAEGYRRGLLKHSGASAFAIILAACLVIALVQGSKAFWWDSHGYWELSEGFNNAGTFSFSHFPYDQLRGYALPLTYYFLHHGGNKIGLGPGSEVNIFNSVLFALLAGVLVPALAKVAWPERPWGLLPRLALGALLLIFWSGYLSYPLSDFPALTAAVLALVAVSRADSPAWLGLAGLATGYAVNARPAYLLLLPLIFVVLAWTWWRERPRMPAGLPRRALCIAALIIGLLVVTVPQSLYEHRATGSYGPLPGGDELTSLQLSAGLKMQRYETFVGGPTPAMEYMDPATRSIRSELPGGRVSGTGKYLRIVAENPLTMAGVFLRHIVNGFDQRYTTPYVEHLEPGWRKLLRLAGFLIVFLGLFRLFWTRGRRSLGAARWRYPLTLLACCATIPASAIETRYALPACILAAMLVLTPGWPDPREAADGARRYRTLGIAAGFLVAYLVVAGLIVHGATRHLELVDPGNPATAFKP